MTSFGAPGGGPLPPGRQRKSTVSSPAESSATLPAPPASVVHAMPSRSESLVMPVPLGVAPQVSDCSRLRHESPEPTIRTQPPFGWRQAWISESPVVAAPPPTASTPPAAIAAAHASPSRPSTFLRLDFMGLLPVELTRPE